MNAGDFNCFRDFLYRNSGISLALNKQYLVDIRLRRLMQEHGTADLAALVRKIELPQNASLKREVIDAMTTNETFWFRDGYPFEYLQRTYVPELLKAPAREPIRIWSAACSTGQEAYSISMLSDICSRQFGGSRARDIRIVGTDISSRVLAEAREGVYDYNAVARGLPAGYLDTYFDVLQPQRYWRIKSNIAARVDFRSLNLLDSFASMGRFHVIFCRNVLIYFDADTKNSVIKKFHQALYPDGLLFLGASENVSGLSDHFEMVNANPGIAYRPIPRSF